ncbi:anti-sigma factor antagonist [Streptomyces sp. NPDC056347]|uniref:anti-sigma factor antagonist n=1 Tax=Streptomyces sp. NPDC056347 TaxID=3345790 RepID=UPI0035DBB1E2
MTIEWRYTMEQDLGVLSVAGYLGGDAVHRFTGAVGWTLARGTGPVVVDCADLHGWSAEGRLAIEDAARELAAHDRTLHLAAIPADGPPVPVGDHPPIEVHRDLTAALAALAVNPGADTSAEGGQEWRTSGWPAVQ